MDETMSLAETESRCELIELEIANIRAQLSAARAEQHAHGVYADPQWYAAATTALRYKGVEHQRLLALRGRLRRDARQGAKNHPADPVKDAFLKMVREKLGDELYFWMWDEARAQAAGTAPAPAHPAPAPNPDDAHDPR